jgi:hypothetical protein
MSATLLGLVVLLAVIVSAMMNLPRRVVCATLILALLQLLDEAPMRFFAVLSFRV